MSKVYEAMQDEKEKELTFLGNERNYLIDNGIYSSDTLIFEKFNGKTTRKFYWNSALNEVVIFDEWAVADGEDSMDFDGQLVGTLSTINQLLVAGK